MSKLAVGQLEGLASEGYKISVASGSQLVQAGAILQVVQTVKTDTFSTTSSSYVDVTGLSVSITPSATSSKILVLADVKQSGGADGYNPAVRLVRDSTNIYLGDTAGNRNTAYYGSNGINSGVIFSATGIYLDSPNTTSSTTYKIQLAAKTVSASYTAGINRDSSDGNVAWVTRTASSITVMEVAG